MDQSFLMSKVWVQDNPGRLSTTIPKSIADLKGWNRGRELELKEHAGFICLVVIK